MKARVHIYKGVVCLVAMAAVAACGEKKADDNIIVKKPVAVAEKPIQRVGDYQQERQFEWNGSTYTVAVERKADAQLPLVDDGEGNRYYDNRITVKIVRQDGSEFFSRAFTKQDFSAYVDEAYKGGALLGVVFDCVDDGVLRFAASVGSPDRTSDEYVPLVMKINRFGETSVSRDTALDTTGEENGAEAAADDDGV